MKLIDYINERHDGNKAAFARSQDVPPQTVTKWIKAEWIVINGRLYSMRREVLQSTT